MATVKQKEDVSLPDIKTKHDAEENDTASQRDSIHGQKTVLPEVAKLDAFGAHEKTDPREIALVKKLDRWIMPMLWAMYFLNYLDRNAIAVAKINKIDKDLGLNDRQYQLCVSILFVGYILGTVPSNLYINRVRPGRYMAIVMMAWAVVSAVTACATNFTGLLVTRFFLGVTEAPFYPGAVYLLTCFYTRKEIASRIAVLYTGNVLSTAFAGLIAAGVFKGMDDLHGIQGWKWLFILQGVVTFAIAVLGYFTLPDFPLETRWLTPEERQLAHNRIDVDTTENKGSTGTLDGLKQAVKDPMVWIFMLMAHMHLAANGFKNFFPSVVNTLGLNETVGLVLVCPPYFLACIVTIMVSWSSGKYNERTWHITISKLVAVIGFIVTPAVDNTAGRYVGMIIFCIGTYGVNSLVLGWCGSVCGQTREKKSAAVGLVVGFMNASFIWTPFLWSDADRPRYTPAMAASAAFSIATFGIAWAGRLILKRRNKALRNSDDETTNFYVY